MTKEAIDISRKTNQYAVKLIHGKIDKESKVKPIGQGVYFTSVNIHNPNKKEAEYHVKIALSGENGTPGPISRWRKYVLKYDEATEFNEQGFQALLGGLFSPFNEGFFVIESVLELDVVGVYSGSAKEDLLSTMYMERVPKRAVEPGKY